MPGLLVNTLTADDQFSRHDLQNFMQQIWNAIILKKRFFWILYCICGIYKIFRTFWKKDESARIIISEIIESERSGYLNA